MLTLEELEEYVIADEDGTVLGYEINSEKYTAEQNFMWYHGRIAPMGSQYTISFLNEIRARMSRGESNIILVTGVAGSGKSWWTIAFCQLIDPYFRIYDVESIKDPSEDHSQVCFSRNHILYLIGGESPLKYHQCVMIDEAQFSAGSRRWYEALQKDLMEQLESVRHRRLVIVIVALHRSLLDRIVRDHVVNYHVHVTGRGTAQPYYTWMPRFAKNAYVLKKDALELPVPDEEICDAPECLDCNLCWGTNKQSFINSNPTNKICNSIRAIYERKKKWYTDNVNKESRQKSEFKERKRKAEAYTDAELGDVIYEHRDELLHTTYGNLQLQSMRGILINNVGIEPGGGRTRMIRDYVQATYPELILGRARRLAGLEE